MLALSILSIKLWANRISCLWLMVCIMSISARDRMVVFGWRYILSFEPSLADVMYKKRSFRVWSRVTYPRRWTISHLHWVAHAWPFSSRLTPRRSLHVHDNLNPQGSMACHATLPPDHIVRRLKGERFVFPRFPLVMVGKHRVWYNFWWDISSVLFCFFWGISLTFYLF